MALKKTAAPVGVTQATLGEFKGTPTLSVGPEGGWHGQALTAGPVKWERIFHSDQEGDPILMQVLAFLRDHGNGAYERALAGLDKFVEVYSAWRKGRN